jgi:hypothetical protein
VTQLGAFHGWLAPPVQSQICNGVPDAVSAGVTAAVTTALGAVGGPLAVAGGAMAGSAVGRQPGHEGA